MEYYLTGLALGAGLIIAIGAQNAFVLSQGIKKSHHMLIPFICSLSDGILISAGVMGVGKFLGSFPVFSTVATALGALFLLWYGSQRIRSFLTKEQLEANKKRPAGTANAILITLAVTWLNPHVYLDTLLLLGSVSNGIPAKGKPCFAAGAVSASVIWFFTLSLGGSRLAPLFRKPLSWKILDLAVALIMFAMAVSLLINLVPK